MAGGAAPSSAALTTSLELLLLMVVFFEGKNTILLLEPEFALVATLGVSKNPEAAEAMLQLAIVLLCLCVSECVRLTDEELQKVE